MIDIKELQKEVIANKKRKGFNTTDLNKEFCYLYGEVGEAFDAWMKNKDDLGGELADVAIFLMGISEILGFDLEKEITDKIEINKKRRYKKVNGVYLKISETNN